MKKHLLTSICLLLFIQYSRAIVHTVNVADFSFTPSSLNMNLGDTIKWVWISGSHNTSGTSIPVGAVAWAASINAGSQTFSYIPAVTGTYNYLCAIHPFMTGTFTVTGCSIPVITAGGPNGGICAGDTALLFTNTTSPNPISRQWLFNGNIIPGANGPQYHATLAGNYSCILVDNCGSDTSNVFTLTINPLPIVTVGSSADTICIGSCAILSAAGNGISYSWMPTGCVNPLAGTIVNGCCTSSTAYVVTAHSAAGCENSAGHFVTVIAVPDASFTFSNSVLDYVFNDQLTGAISWHWHFGDGDTSVSQFPFHAYGAPGSYTVTLIVSNGFCTDTMMQHITAVGIEDANANSMYTSSNLVLSDFYFQIKDGSVQVKQVTVYDPYGRICDIEMMEERTGSYTIHMQSLPTGIYYLKIETTHFSKVLKLMKN